MPSNANALIGTGALVSGGGRKTAAAGSAGGAPLVPGGPSYAPPSFERSPTGEVFRRVNVGGSDVIIKPGRAAGGVKRQLHTEEERLDFARIRKTSGGDVLMKPKDVGQGVALSKSPWVAISDADSQSRIRVFRECYHEAAAMVWNHQQVPHWMLWEEGKEYNPPAGFVHGILHNDAELPPADDQPGMPLIKTGEQPQSAPQGAAQPAGNPAAEAQLRARIQQLENQVQQLQTRASHAFKPRKAVIDIEGFGEVETTVDWYTVTGNVLTLAYDSAKGRNILTPKPSEGRAVAEFILELHDGNEKHVFELVAAYNSRVEFPAAGPAGATFQQFLIKRHQSVTA